MTLVTERVWDPTLTGNGPAACPVCGSVGAAARMGRHFTDSHSDLPVDASSPWAVRCLALYGELGHAMGGAPANDRTLEYVRGAARRWWLRCAPEFTRNADGALVLVVNPAPDEPLTGAMWGHVDG